MTTSALPETLKSITAVKIQELTRQRDNLEANRKSIYSKALAAKDPLSATQALLDGTRRLKNIRLFSDDSSDDGEGESTGAAARQLHNRNFLLRQAAVDPSIQTSVVTNIQKTLQRELDLESIKHEHAQFFSELVTEWLSDSDHQDSTSESTNFEQVGRKEMHEQRATWERLAFSSASVDTAKIEEYLKRLFTSTKATQLAYEQIVKNTKTMCSTLIERTDVFDPDSLKGTMNGLLRTDLFSEEKNATLRTFVSNKEVLKEVCDVLNMRYASLSTWTWTTNSKGLAIEMRRALNGKYRVYMDEDVLDALMLYEIGLKWSVHFKDVFTAYFNSFAWKRSEKIIPKRDRERRDFFLQNDKNTGSDTVQSIRRAQYSSDYFLTQLPINEQMGKRGYDEDNDDDEELGTMKSPLDLKHGLLHMLVAEALVARDVRPTAVHTVIRSDFKWFGPSLPHGTIFTILKFFGVDDTWLNFFRKFLETPLFFIHDGPKAQVQTRKRGIPLSHTISDFIGEVVLFVMDVSVNQATSSYLYRLHDDFWLWGPEEVCLQGWQAMTQYASVTGIEFNEEKTGTVRFGESSANDSSDSDTSDSDDFAYGPDTKSLPSGEVRWGFLRLDAPSGLFLVDQAQVDDHIKELQLQLSYCKSIFSYIQSYNAYAGRFFTNNFGKPSFGFGRQHVDMMIKTFVRIQKTLFPSGSVTDYLSTLAEERFGIKDLPQGFWYFPVQQGGLELVNPLIPLLGMRESLRSTPERMIKKCRNEEEAEYLRAEDHFKNHASSSGFGSYKPDLVRDILDKGETFMPKDEYFRYREERSTHLAKLYKKFLEVPEKEEMAKTAELEAILSQGNPDLPGRLRKGEGISSHFHCMNSYWKWIIALYGKDIADRYGSVQMVEPAQVPIGVVSLMKQARVKWKG